MVLIAVVLKVTLCLKLYYFSSNLGFRYQKRYTTFLKHWIRRTLKNIVERIFGIFW